VYDVHDWTEVRRLYHREKLSKTAIARRLGMSRPTVIKLLELPDPPRYEREPAGSKNARHALPWRSVRGEVEGEGVDHVRPGSKDDVGDFGRGVPSDDSSADTAIVDRKVSIFSGPTPDRGAFGHAWREDRGGFQGARGRTGLGARRGHDADRAATGGRYGAD
jgi:hypothetical protein